MQKGVTGISITHMGDTPLQANSFLRQPIPHHLMGSINRKGTTERDKVANQRMDTFRVSPRAHHRAFVYLQRGWLVQALQSKDDLCQGRAGRCGNHHDPHSPAATRQRNPSDSVLLHHRIQHRGLRTISDPCRELPNIGNESSFAAA